MSQNPEHSPQMPMDSHAGWGEVPGIGRPLISIRSIGPVLDILHQPHLDQRDRRFHRGPFFLSHIRGSHLARQGQDPEQVLAAFQQSDDYPGWLSDRAWTSSVSDLAYDVARNRFVIYLADTNLSAEQQSLCDYTPPHTAPDTLALVIGRLKGRDAELAVPLATEAASQLPARIILGRLMVQDLAGQENAHR